MVICRETGSWGCGQAWWKRAECWRARWPLESTVFTVAWHFVDPAPEWTVSVERPEPYRGSLQGLFDPELDLSGHSVSGLGDACSFPSFAQSPGRFTCRVDDEMDVATLIRLMVVP